MTLGERVIAFIETFLVVPEGDKVGKPLTLAEFQRRFILDVYDNPHGTTNAYLSIGRKNGKTGLIASLLLAHLDGPPALRNAHIISGAQSREQASIVFRLAAKMVMMSPTLSERIKITPSKKMLHGLAMGTTYQALSAEAKTALGESPALAILDEVGQVVGPQDDFIDAITTAQGAYEAPLLIAISTQARTDGDLFSIWLDDAQAGQDPHTIAHVYAADNDAGVMSKKAWRAANPALGLFRSEADVRRQANRAKRMPSAENSFRNLILNQRIERQATLVSKSVWTACNGKPAPLSGATAAFAGLDLSSRSDLTAFVVCFFDEAGVLHVHPHFWTPAEGLAERSRRDRVPYDVWARKKLLRTTPGATVDYAFVVRDIADLMADVDIVQISFDRWRIEFLEKEAERQGVTFPLLSFGQGYKDMAPAIDIIESLLLDRKVRHGAHPVLSMCAANAVVKSDEAGNRKLNKAAAAGRIDGMVALAMAVGGQAKEITEPAPNFDAMAAIG